jgi:hypothetical protein
MKPLYCSYHKKDNMVNVKSAKCIHDNCDKIPHYNIAGEKAGLYCIEHKSINMINVKISYCNDEKCTKQGMFSLNPYIACCKDAFGV